MMKLSLLAFSLILSLRVYSQENEQILYWSSIDSLQWSDFKGKPDSLYYASNGKTAQALSSVGIKFFELDSLDSQACYQLRAVFYCSESWHITHGVDLLNHERGHFDLMELRVRKLRKCLINLTAMCEGFSIADQVNLTFSKYDSITVEYDRQTLFGTLSTVQNIWNERVKKELAELEDYSADTVICLCE